MKLSALASPSLVPVALAALLLPACSSPSEPAAAPMKTSVDGPNFNVEAMLPLDKPQGEAFGTALAFARSTQRDLAGNPNAPGRGAERVVFRFVINPNGSPETTMVMQWPMPYFLKDAASATDAELVANAEDVAWGWGVRGENEVKAFCRSQAEKASLIPACVEIQSEG